MSGGDAAWRHPRRTFHRLRRGAPRRVREVRSRAQRAISDARLHTDPAVRVILGSGAFDRAWYSLLRRRQFTDDVRAVEHYVREGWRSGASPHPLFEPRYWDPAFREREVDPFSRFLADAEGQRQRRPHPVVDLEAYAAEHPSSLHRTGGPFADLVSRLGPDTPISLDRLLDRPASAPWATVRRVLQERAEEWLHGERLRTAPRLVERTRPTRAEREFAAARSALEPPAAMQEPLVTVVLPVRDRSRALREAVASVQAQTLPDWELLVVDDGSVDDTPLVVEGLAEHDHRIRLLPTTPRGVSHARNTALAVARGAYVAFLDSDNTWLPDFLRTMVSAMAQRDLPAAYASMEVVEPDGGAVLRRDFDGGREYLVVANHVDLNVLVVRADRCREVGGFDEGLRRAVDYDYVLRLVERGQLVHLPFVGARYLADPEDAARVSNRESITWNHVVRARHTLDWTPTDRVPGRTSVLLMTTGKWRKVAERVREALEDLDAAAPDGRADVDVVVVDRASDRLNTSLLSLLPLVEPRITVVRTPRDHGPAISVDVALLRSTGTSVVVLPLDAQLEPGCLPALLEGLRDPGAAAVQPVLLNATGAWTATLGGALAPRATTPVDVLPGHARDEVEGRAPLAVPLLRGWCFAARAADLAAVHGVDPLFAGDCADADLSLRLLEHRSGEIRVLPAAMCRLHRSDSAEAALAQHDGASFRDRWSGRLPPGLPDPWAAFDLAAVHAVPAGEVTTGPDGTTLTAVDPVRAVVVAPRRVVADGPGAGLPVLRWALKTAAPQAGTRDTWGDWLFAQDLAGALRRLGQTVVVDTATARVRPAGALDDVVLTLRGLVPVPLVPGATHLLWIISHPEVVTADEVQRYDAAFAASVPWAAEVTRHWGVPVRPLPQCTDAHRFAPDAAEPDTGARVLFVGNSRGVFRPVVQAALTSGVPLTLIGVGWADFVPPETITSEQLPADRVPAAYAAASVVLNDHWAEMRERGFVSNRLFDAAATATRVLSDDVAGMDEYFGEVVVTYRDRAHLVELLRAPVDEVFPDREARLEVAKLVARDHSFDARARTLLEAALERREPR